MKAGSKTANIQHASQWGACCFSGAKPPENVIYKLFFVMSNRKYVKID